MTKLTALLAILSVVAIGILVPFWLSVDSVNVSDPSGNKQALSRANVMRLTFFLLAPVVAFAAYHQWKDSRFPVLFGLSNRQVLSILLVTLVGACFIWVQRRYVSAMQCQDLAVAPERDADKRDMNGEGGPDNH